MKKNDSLVEYFTKKKSQIIKSFILIILFLSSVVILNNNYSDNPFIAKLYLEGMISNETNLLEKIDQLKEKENLKGIFLKDKRDESDFNHTLSLIKQYEIIKECYQKANHYINLASNSLSIFKDCNERNILENLT